MSARALQAALFVIVAASVPVAALAVPRAGEAAPGFALKRVDTNAVQTLAALKGKPVYLVFFASWCGPCNDEAPSIVKLAAKYRPRGLVTLGVSELDQHPKTLEFLKKYGIRYEVVVDDDGTMGKYYGALGLPVHVFIDRKGTVSTYRLGEMSPGEIDDAIKKII
jgi:peroxiredoxin